MVGRKLRHQAARIARNRYASGVLVVGYSSVQNNCQHNAISEGYSVSSPSVARASEFQKTFSDPAKRELVPLKFDKTPSDKKEVKRLERNTKIMKMLAMVVLLYAICLLPNQVVWLCYEFGNLQNWPHFSKLLTFGSIMVYINSCVNPLLYAGMNEDFRKGFCRILRCKWKPPLTSQV